MNTEIRTFIVDDDDAVRRLHARFLHDVPGFRLIGSSRSGSGAIHAAAHANIDLLLLDMRLPDFSGIEVLHRLREEQGAAVDVFVISSARDRVTVRQALSAHIVGYLVKPFTEEAFVGRLTAYREAKKRKAEARFEADIALGQGEIDRFLRGEESEEALSVFHDLPLPKGLAASTMDRIIAALADHHSATGSEVEELTGASRATVRRYLDYLVRSGRVDISHRYGKRGRPEILYRLVP